MRSSTFPSVLSDLLRVNSARPFVTFYDDATGERVELSVATYSNWVNKTANLVQDELDLERGALMLVDLPTHWLGAVWLGAAWTGGVCVTTDRSLAKAADLVVCGPKAIDRYADKVDEDPVVAISLRPLGARFADPLPVGVTDYGAVVLAQPDEYVSFDPPTAEDAAWRYADRSVSQRDLLESASHNPLVGPGGRLLTDVNPCSEEGLDTLLSPLLQSGGAVWVAHPDESLWERRRNEERATARLRARPA